MPTVEVQIDSNVAEVLRHFEVLPTRVQQGARAGLRAGCAAIAGAVQRRITDTFRTTGADGLRKSVVSEVPSDGDLEGRVAVTKRYASVHEFGTVGKGGQLPDIVPVHAKALRFPVAFSSQIAWRNTKDWRRLKTPQTNEKFIFVKRVSIPARPFFFPAVQESLPLVAPLIRQQVNAALASMRS